MTSYEALALATNFHSMDIDDLAVELMALYSRAFNEALESLR